MIPATRSLLRAVVYGDLNLVRALLSQGTNVNQTTASGQTALMFAAVFGHEDIARLLLTAGAKTDLEDEIGLTAVDYSLRSGFPDIGELINNGSRPTPVEKENDQPNNTDAPVQSGLNTERARPTKIHSSAEMFPSKVPPEHSEEIARPTPRLPGLAGAILRERVAGAPGRTFSSEPISATAESIGASPTSVDHSSTSPTVEQESDSLNNGFLTSQAISVENPNTIVAPVSPEDTLTRTSVLDADLTETTVPGKLRVSPLDHPVREQNQAKRTSRIDVPSFSSISEGSGSRPVFWVLVVVFLGAGAFAGYALSNYLSNKAAPTVAASTSPSEPARGPAPVKAGPKVAGDLEGCGLFLPDAETTSKDVSGTVTVQVQVDRKGSVVSAHAVDGDERLQAAAVEAAKRSAFSPEKLPEKGRVVNGTITYTFVSGAATANTQHGTNAGNAPASTNPSPDSASLSPSSNESVHRPRGVLTTTGGPLVGAELELPQPQYPENAKRRGISGRITIVVRVNRFGKVISWRTLDGDPELRAAALKAAKQATFTPKKLPGNGEVVGTITYDFKL